MTKQILLSVQELHAALDNTDCVIVDCRFVLEDTDAGYEDYLDSHIPGAVYAHLDNDLSSPPSSTGGRHPLPDANKME
jgi:thiosulfate/3-mercaptopyruvate sulfurtransferase